MSVIEAVSDRDRPSEKPNPPAKPTPSLPAKGNRTRRRAFAIFGIVLVAAALAYGVILLFAPPGESTDDAYVGGNIISITARDGGTVLALRADNTQQVQRGETLIELDPATQSVNLAAAEANLGRAVRAFRVNISAVDQASAEMNRAKAELERASNDLSRRQAAVGGGAVSREEVSHAADAVTTARAALDLAKSRHEQAASLVSGTDVYNNPGVLAAIADVRRAAIDLSHMSIVAPMSGVVAQRAVQLGQRVAAGAPLMSIVPLDNLWVDANFRETQLRDIRVGQPAAITADVYGGSVRFRGRVLGLAAGSGSAFALLPAQNASGNWIKIVQRVPVRIALDPAELRDHPLRVGLSVTAEIETGDRSGPFASSSAAPAGGDLSSMDGGSDLQQKIDRIIQLNMGREP